FMYIALHQLDIEEFGSVMTRNPRIFVKYIFLRLELLEYDYKGREKRESLEDVRMNNLLFPNAVGGLFFIL
ncbi:hypothetical protein CI102_10085, partial [Trichoderma harzianum]